MAENDWAGAQQLSLLYSWHEGQQENPPLSHAVAILFNSSVEKALFTLPGDLRLDWVLRFFSSDTPPAEPGQGQWELGAHSLVLATMGLQAGS